MIVQLLVAVIVSGYGMLITRSRINKDKGLPKIVIKDIISLGIKSSVVLSIYIMIQGMILTFICSLFNFPIFDLKERLLDWPYTISLLLTQDPMNSLLFIFVGGSLFYTTTFFIEIALAKLADTNSILSSFNILSITRDIAIMGWLNYAKHYTAIILAILILTCIIYINIPITFFDSIIDMILAFLIFVTEYLGIGAIYSQIKDLKTEKHKIPIKND